MRGKPPRSRASSARLSPRWRLNGSPLSEPTVVPSASTASTPSAGQSSGSRTRILLEGRVAHWNDHFIAITDEGTALAERARQQQFRELFINPSDIGGRYSALSFFGLVPAALMGLDLDALDRWASEGVPPPPSRVPRRADGTLVTAAEWREAFPAIPGAVLPRGPSRLERLDFGPEIDRGLISEEPPRVPLASPIDSWSPAPCEHDCRSRPDPSAAASPAAVTPGDGSLHRFGIPLAES